jgi:two-component sensor histidine kinase
VFKLTLNQRLLLAVLTALLPIAVFSVYQAISNQHYSQQLIADRLAVNALAAASDQREPINAAQLMLATLVQNPDVYDATPRCQEIFRENLRAQSALVNIVWSDAAGVPRCSVLPVPPGVSYSTSEWWKRGVASRQFVLSAPVVGQISQSRVIIAMQPLFSSSGTYVGAVSTGINLSWIEHELGNSDTSPTSLIGIADANGKIVMTSGPRRFQKIDIAKSFGAAATVDSYDGEEWMYSSAPLYENQLHVVYAEQAQPLILPIRDQLRAGVLWPLLAVMLTMLAVWVGVNKMVVRWLKELGQVTRQFASGDYSERRARFLRAPPEIAEVGADLHSMAQAITHRSEALEASIKLTRSMAREVNHRVKNNLQMIMSLLALQSAQVKNDEAKTVLDQTRVRMAALALIHRLLYEKGEEADQGEVDMDRLFQELCHQLRNSVGAQKDVKLTCQADVGNRPVDEAIPVALLAVEAITNVYRHAFPAGHTGTVRVNLSQADDIITLDISDQGVGFDPDTNQNFMGMDLIRAFVEQLDGKLVIDAAPNNGVSITLSYSATRIMRMAD